MRKNGFEFKPFSEKQLDVILNADAFINILEGAVRSGKTIASNVRWINFIAASPHDKFLMSGESTDSLYRNVIDDIIKIVGEDNARYLDSAKGGAQLIFNFDGQEKICYCRGASKSNDEGKIRGITIGGWYADEITLHHSDFIKQAIARMSLEGAIALWTTNPDSPYHKIKTDYIDKANEKGFKHWKFNLNDNAALSERYKKNLKKSYSGIFYDRFIKGLWVLAEGVIYDMFNRKKHVVESKKREYTSKVVAVDYGTQNPTAFGKFEKIKGLDKWYKTEEYHHSGRETGVQKTDEEYADDMENFLYGELMDEYTHIKAKLKVATVKLRKHPKSDIHRQAVISLRKEYRIIESKYLEAKRTKIIIDPSAASFIVALKKRGLKVVKADNDVKNGIRRVATAISNGQLLICNCCKETIKEFGVYIWDEKASLKGEDKPIKENDHHMDLIRYFVNTVLFNKNIRENLSRKGVK